MNRRLLLSIGSAIGISGTAVGGIFLDKHIKKNMFLSKIDAGTKKLEEQKLDDSMVFAGINYPDEFGRILGIFEVIRHIEGNIKNFTNEEKQEKEKSFGNSLLDSYPKLPISKSEKSSIGSRYTNYGEKFKGSCLQFQSGKNASDIDVNENSCVALEDLRDPSKYSEKFFWYDEAKKSSLDIDEFYGTKARKFQSTNEYIKGANKTQENKEKFSNGLISNNSKITAK